MRVSEKAIRSYQFDSELFMPDGDVRFRDAASVQACAAAIRAKRFDPARVQAGDINAISLLHEIQHIVCLEYKTKTGLDLFASNAASCALALQAFVRDFPPPPVYEQKKSAAAWLTDGSGKQGCTLEEVLLMRLTNENQALIPYSFLFLPLSPEQNAAADAVERAFQNAPPMGTGGQGLPDFLRAPMRASPHSLAGQLEYIRRNWASFLGDRLARLLGGLDMLAEENRLSFPPGQGPLYVPDYAGDAGEYERFSEDKDWMPRVVMIAKSVLVWLDQLSKKYGRGIHTLDAIPDEELALLASRGFNALWLIGIWERSAASRRIKELCGNPEAAASAYSLYDYEIAAELGGWSALGVLRAKAAAQGIRLAADMVPNHTGLDSAWMRERPDLFMQRASPPFAYSYNGENLSGDGAIGLWLEDHYYDRRDAAVTFKRVDFRTGKTSYIYHGNDGTSMPWNDTAQIDFLKPEARKAVLERILHVARNFPIIRFDAAMVLAKKSFRRLWYPEPGSGSSIASRYENAMDAHSFDSAMPHEFWREVVDSCAAEVPDTLLLAEAFWMMEGYFVRTLGMHRVYNSAFMNMLRDKKNAEYRAAIKNTIGFDKDILKRFVNFMNNPDEDTAVAQFGDGDHYFGVCSLMATMPGLPMFGHGQMEGFSEKYGMEYRRAYKNETPNEALVRRHEKEIVPLLKRRYLFSGVDNFLLYDLVTQNGSADENVFIYSNGCHNERALVIYNNAWERTSGRIRMSLPYTEKKSDGAAHTITKTLAEGLSLRGGHGRFTLMYEMKSGLNYVRLSDELIHAGLCAALEGFQCQVFVNIHEITDGEKKLYAALCSSLGGRGVANISDALCDIEWGDEYAAWNALTALLFFEGIDTADNYKNFSDVYAALVLQCNSAAAHCDTAAAHCDTAAAHCETTAPPCHTKLVEAAAAFPSAKPALYAAVSLVPMRDNPALFASMERQLKYLFDKTGDDTINAALALVGAEWLALLCQDRFELCTETMLDCITLNETAERFFGVNAWNNATWVNAERFTAGAELYAALHVACGYETNEAAQKKAAAVINAAKQAGWNIDAVRASAAENKSATANKEDT